MKIMLIAIFALLGADYAFAGGGAPVPPVPESSPPSGRPSEVLDDAKCQAVWESTERQGDMLYADKAAPFVTNFHLVDKDGDGKVSLDEFKAACKKGLIEAGTASRLPTGKASPEVPKE